MIFNADSDAIGSENARGAKPAVVSNSASEAGSQWGESKRFQVLELLGRGGMGAVLRVIDRSTGEEVALKRLHVDGTESESLRSKALGLFEREFRTLSQLSHPRIINVYDYGVDEAGPYYTMELLGGDDLRNQLPLPWKTMCRIGRDIASSLAILHARRIVHRDVSPANIRCSTGGQAKLIDFGAMALMGPVDEVVGTAPFIAPEMTRTGVLDGRYDLYALGATLYLGISGRLACTERKISRLESAWKLPVRALNTLCPEVPDGLNALVMDLISLDPMVRPQNAALVFERLSAIAELPRDEGLDVASAYLSVPTLVGRDAELARCRRRLLRTKAGKGRALMVLACAGIGRSRLLDAVSLDAKLLGLTVVRAGRADAGELGAFRQLAQALVRAHPNALPASGAVCSLVKGAALSAQREPWLEEVNAWFVETSRTWPTVLVVDDVHAVDELSAVALAGLSREVRGSSLMLICAQERGAPCRFSGALGLLTEAAETLNLQALSEPEVRSLAASMFTDGDNLGVLSSVLYAHASGNPAETIHAAQTLLKAGAIGYAAGAWELPAAPSTLRIALPRDEGLPTRIAGASPDARTVALVSALDIHRVVGVSDFGELLGHVPAQQVYDAVAALVELRILVEVGTDVSLARESHHSEIVEAFSQAECSDVHRRLSGWYLSKGRPAVAGHHAACAGEWGALLNIMQSSFLLPGGELPWESEPTGLETIDRLICKCDEDREPPPCVLALRCKFTLLCAERDEWGRVVRHLPATLSGLKSRCGLVDYAELSGLPDGERLSQAIARAEARHTAVPGEFSLVEALTALPTALLTAGAAALLADDVLATDSIPSLEPLFPLSPAYPLVEKLVLALVECCRGRIDLSLSGCTEVYTKLDAGPVDGLSNEVQRSLLRFALGLMQGIEASMGRPEVLERADPARSRNAKATARERHAYYVAIGDVERATAERRELERLEIFGGAERAFPTNWETSYGHCSLTSNLQGLKRCERQARYVAEQLPNWQRRVELSKLSQLMCGTVSESILARINALCESTVWGTADYRYAQFLRSDCLFGMGRYEECRTAMLREIELLGRPGDWFDAYELFLARAEAALGMRDEAREHSQRYAQMYEKSGVRGVLVGRTHEDLARVGLLIGDVEQFRSHAARCAEEYKCGFNPALTARYEWLIREAKSKHVSVSEELEHAAEFADRAPVSKLVSQFNTQISTCLDAGDRLRTLLSLAVERSGAKGGSLHVIRAEGLRREAILGCAGPALDIDEAAHQFWQSELMLDEMVTATDFQEPGAGRATSELAGDGGQFMPLMLSDGDELEPRYCGVLMLLQQEDETLCLDPHVTAALSLLILQHESVVCVTRE